MGIAEVIKLALQLSLFLSTFGYGLKATSSDAFYLFRKPGQLIRSVLAMNIIMPLGAIFFALLFDLPQLVKIVLLALAISPLAPLFPVKSLQMGGRDSYVIGLMVAAALWSVVLIPVTIILMGSVIHKPLGFSTKAIVFQVMVSVLVPLLLGVTSRYFALSFSEKIAGPLIRVAQFLLMASVLPLIFKVFPVMLSLVGNGTVLAIGAFVIVGVLTGHLLSGPALADRTVLALGTAARHPAIAITVASANLTSYKLVPATIILYMVINWLLAVPFLKLLQQVKALKMS